MTTPAENWQVTNTASGQSYRYFPGDPGWQLDGGPFYSLFSHERLARPQSVTSPFRADGTRAPKDYFRNGGISYMPMAQMFWSQDPANVYRYYTEPFQYVDLLVPVSCPGVDSDVITRARMKYYKNVKNSKVNLGVALGEARQTARLLTSSASRIAAGVRSFRKGNLKKVWADLTSGANVPNAWLELQYGWNPLLRDVFGSAEALAESISIGRRLNLVVKGSASKSDPLILERESNDAFMVRYDGRDKQRCEVVGNYDLPSSILPAFSSLGLTNPLEIVWELVPYSFVVDWCFPIGDWLATLDAGAFLHFNEGSESIIRRRTAAGVMLVSPHQGFKYNRSVKPIRKGLYRAYSFNRGVLYNPPFVDLPKLRSPLSLGKMANALSLLASAFSRRG